MGHNVCEGGGGGREGGKWSAGLGTCEYARHQTGHFDESRVRGYVWLAWLMYSKATLQLSLWGTDCTLTALVNPHVCPAGHRM
jgi:hypothetical protein